MLEKELGHYRLLSKLGEGGMGIVYRAHDEVLHRDVALKIVSQPRASDDSSKQFLLREARAASAVSHPNICTIYEVGEFDGEAYIVMELVEGQPLNSMIGAAGLAVESVMRYGVQIAAALKHAHGRNVAHRDLKSSNLIVNPDGLIKVLDFGIARRLPGESFHEAETISPSEGVGVIVGTLSYMSPEVLRGRPGDELSDLWALGVVLYEASSGQLPFGGQTAFEVSSAILNDLPAPLPFRVPPNLAAIIHRCLAKEPAQRYQSAGEVLAALEAVQASSVIVAPPPADQQGLGTIVLRGIQHLNVKSSDVLMLVGTTKGAFLLRSNSRRSRWDVAGPYFHGQSVYAMAYDSREGRHTIWASTQSVIWGTVLRSTDDYGKSWTNPREAQIKFPPESGASLNQVWQICLGRDDEPDTLYCGVDPAALFLSRDNGETWSLVRALYNHPHRQRWLPGAGGLMVHTILPDPRNRERMHVAISAGGVYLTEDGGNTWEARNRGVRVVFAPERYPEFGQCVHKVVSHPSNPDRLFLQNHWGLYRSDDGGSNWEDIANGVPSDFGFAMVMHPHDPDCVYILPVESDEFRCTPQGRLRVFRTRNAGESWEPLTRGLPQKRAYETVVREGMTSDSFDPVGLYFGTRSGVLYNSRDEGKTWEKILEGLPPVVCVKVAVVGQPRGARKPAESTKAARPAQGSKAGRVKKSSSQRRLEKAKTPAHSQARKSSAQQNDKKTKSRSSHARVAVSGKNKSVRESNSGAMRKRSRRTN